MEHSKDTLPPTFPEGPRCPYCNSDEVFPIRYPSGIQCRGCTVQYGIREQAEYMEYRAQELGRSVFRKTHPEPRPNHPYT